jgi:hypothetical protein
MRGHMDASEYKHVCLGLIFVKYISDAFEEKREKLLFGFSNPKSEWFIKDEPQRAEAAENRDEYLSACAMPTVFAQICIPTSRPISFWPTRRSTPLACR